MSVIILVGILILSLRSLSEVVIGMEILRCSMIKLLDWLDKYAFQVSACWFLLAMFIYGPYPYWVFIVIAATLMCIAGWVALLIKGLLWMINALQ